jgi:hypothetical protein
VAELALKAVAATFQTKPIPTTDILNLVLAGGRNAVLHFAINSASYSPLRKGMYMAGDWSDRTGQSFWSTEKAVATGWQAAQAFLADLGASSRVHITPAVSDNPSLKDLRHVAKVLRQVSRSPWLFVKVSWYLALLVPNKDTP